MRKKGRENKNLALSLAILVISMAILGFASVPIYNLFCKATGFGGTTQILSDNVSLGKKGKRKITVEFDANAEPGLPWKFYPKQRRVSLLTGENAIVFYESENISAKDIIGTAVYNVTPNKAGKYFVKIHCFCFEEQLLKAGEKVLMPVSFLIDPALDDDPDMEGVSSIVLSYSFFKIREISPR